MILNELSEESINQVANQLLMLIGIMVALVVAPAMAAASSRVNRSRLWPKMVAIWRWLDRPIWSPMASIAIIIHRIRMRLNPVAENRRELGQYLAALPPHSGLTAYEEMANEIAALPPCPAKSALKAYFKKVKPPSRRVYWRARRMAGKPQVSRVVVWSLLAGKEPPYIKSGDYRAIQAAKQAGVAA